VESVEDGVATIAVTGSVSLGEHVTGTVTIGITDRPEDEPHSALGGFA
jgi:hypothetical protein